MPCADAGFAFEPISPFRRGLARHWKRAVRYGGGATISTAGSS